jgi:hypothetical protein
VFRELTWLSETPASLLEGGNANAFAAVRNAKTVRKMVGCMVAMDC